MLKSWIAVAIATVWIISGPVYAQQRPSTEAGGRPAATEPPAESADDEAKDEDKGKDEDKDTIGGVRLGAGIGVTFDFGGLERINEAEVVNGVVRVTDEDDVIAGFVGEGHYFFPSGRALFGVAKEDWGQGPFFAIQTGDKDVIATVALGWMIGFRPAKATESFNLGIGIAVAPNVRTLGDGIVRNQPLPTGETTVRYREEAQFGMILLFSRTF